MEQIESIIQNVKNELSNWKMFLNNTIGILSFGFGLGSLGTGNPSLYAWISLAFVCCIYIAGRNLFPNTIKTLRKKQVKEEAEVIVLKGLEKHFFSLRVLTTEYIVYSAGFIFLICVALRLL